jgi:hypothetical protein
MRFVQDLVALRNSGNQGLAGKISTDIDNQDLSLVQAYCLGQLISGIFNGESSTSKGDSEALSQNYYQNISHFLRLE